MPKSSKPQKRQTLSVDIRDEQKRAYLAYRAELLGWRGPNTFARELIDHWFEEGCKPVHDADRKMPHMTFTQFVAKQFQDGSFGRTAG